MLYELVPIIDIPEYEGFAWADRHASVRGQPSLTMDFDPELCGEWPEQRPVQLRSLWKPAAVKGRVQPWNDYPAVSLNVPAFSIRAVQSLQELLEPHGELLPLVTDVGEYYAYNVLTVVDVLDEEKSFIHWSSTRSYASRIYRFECRNDMLEGQSIFRLPQQMSNYFVTEVFAERVRKHHLQGFDLAKVWPLGPDEDWWKIQMQRRKRWQKQAAEFRRKHVGDASVPPLAPWQDI